jgi:C1A family cysteine protease
MIVWEEMNHSIVILGWGTDKESGANYWIGRNSFGLDWGMNGDFYVKKGNNDFGVEVE